MIGNFVVIAGLEARMKRSSGRDRRSWWAGWRQFLVTTVVIITITEVSACDSHASNAGHAATGSPCALAVIRDAARKVVGQSGGTLQDIHGFGCSGNFAYAFVDIRAQGNVNSVTLLFKASGKMWIPATRRNYCTNGSVPRNIYANACVTQ
jgi:hypothetical protein